MRSFFKAAAVLLPPLSYTLVIPTDRSLSRDGGHAIASSLHREAAKLEEFGITDSLIRFKIPCPECSEEERAAIEQTILSLQVLPSEHDICAFDSASDLRFNGEPLVLGNVTQNPLRRSRRGDLTLKSPFSRDSREVSVFWENYCMDDEFVLTMELFNIGRDSHPGFTISYKKSKQPSLVRLSSFPDKDGLQRFGKSKHWSSPVLPDLPVHETPARPDGIHYQSDSSLQYALTTSNLPETAADPSEPLSSMPELDSIVSERGTAEETFVSQSAEHSPDTDATRELEYFENRSGTWHGCKHRLTSALGDGLKKVGSQAHTFTQNHLQWLVHLLESSSTSRRFYCFGPSKSIMFQNMKENDLSHVMSDTGMSEATPASQATSPAISSRSAETSTSPPSLDQPQVQQQALYAFVVTAAILIVVFLAGFAFFLLRRDPRRRAERAARREERRNKRLFRRAARKQKLKNFIRRVTGRSGPTDGAEPKPRADPRSGPPSPGINWDEWTEKHVAALQRDPHPFHGVRDELRAFRSAHRHVDGILSAEEGHGSAGETSGGEGACGSGNGGGGGGSGPEDEKARYEALLRRRRAQGRRAQERYRARQSARRNSEANSEKTAPPPYDEFEITVADGIQYVRPVVVETVTPDSSVVATSTRASAVDSDEEAEKP